MCLKILILMSKVTACKETAPKWVYVNLYILFTKLILHKSYVIIIGKKSTFCITQKSNFFYGKSIVGCSPAIL